jgi:hypothetical protein
MPPLNWISLHRLWSLGWGGLVLAVLAAAGLWFFVVRSPGTAIDLRQALAQYRQDQRSGPAAPRGTLPPPGVYLARTSGSERLSVGGVTRTFPTTTPMVVTGGGCSTVDWEPFEQHREEMVVCPVAGRSLAMTSALTFEQIGGLETTSPLTCGTGAFIVLPAAARTRWQATCTSPTGRVSLAGRLLGTTSVVVGGREVTAVHTRVTLGFSGTQTGTNPTDYWISAGSGLILREVESVDITQRVGALGWIRFTEHMTIALVSTTPAR